MMLRKKLQQEQKQALKITQEAFAKIKVTYDGIVKSFQHTAVAMRTINNKSNEVSNQTQDMAAVAEELNFEINKFKVQKAISI